MKSKINGIALGLLIATVGSNCLAQVEASDLDITMTVVEEGQDVSELLNNIELPQDVRDLIENSAAFESVMADAMETGRFESREEVEAYVKEIVTRSNEAAMNALAEMDTANASAQEAATIAREAVEDALKNALSGAEIEGIVEDMTRDILENLPQDVLDELPDNFDALIEEALNARKEPGES